MDLTYYSQYSIEPIIEELLKIERGFFIEIGAADGIKFSTTKYFENKGWNGICIEPNPNQYKLLKDNRNCETINCAIWNQDGETEFVLTTGYTIQLNGILSEYDPRHLGRLENELKYNGGEKEIIKVETKRFSSIVNSNQTINFLSIDTEGSELSILKAIDFKEYDIKVMCIENNFNEPEIANYLNKYDYSLYGTYGGADQIYVKK